MDDNQKLIERIEINPKKLGGKPVIRGTRISVEQILNMVAAGISTVELLKDFPQLTENDIHAAIYYASRLMGDFQVYPKEYITQIDLQAV